MLVGLGGNNGTTLTAGVIANKHGIKWETKTGVQHSNYFGSLTQCSVTRLGNTDNNEEVNVPLKSLLPMLNPSDLIISGWDINGANMAQALKRAQVMDFDLQRQLYPYMEKMIPLPSVFDPKFIAANQSDRADNVLKGTRQENLDVIRGNIRDFKMANNLESVIVLWTANTERYAEERVGLNDTEENLLAAIKRNEEEIAPSTIFAVACILEHVPFINGSPQNTLVPGVMQLAEKHKTFVCGDDFKTGQTKIKSVLADFLVSVCFIFFSLFSFLFSFPFLFLFFSSFSVNCCSLASLSTSHSSTVLPRTLLFLV